MNKFNLFDIETENDKTYTQKVKIPQYLPSNECPNIFEIYSKIKYETLIQHINASNVSADEKEFLKFAATRHIIFNYSKIADYYAHASKEMQELLEESALVIIDFDDAIANGYVKLSKKIEKIMYESGAFPKGRSKADIEAPSEDDDYEE